jgi:antitoxin PrlF
LGSAMNAQAKVTSKGQVTLPKAVRDRYGIKPGDVIEFVEQNGKTWVRARNVRAVDLIGILGPPPSGKSLSVEEMDRALMDAVSADDVRIQREWHTGLEEEGAK